MKTFLAVLLLLTAFPVLAAEAPPVPAPQPPPEPVIPPAAEAPYQVHTEIRQHIRWLDPAVFTEISPLTVPENGIRLPDDQQN